MPRHCPHCSMCRLGIAHTDSRCSSPRCRSACAYHPDTAAPRPHPQRSSLMYQSRAPHVRGSVRCQSDRALWHARLRRRRRRTSWRAIFACRRAWARLELASLAVDARRRVELIVERARRAVGRRVGAHRAKCTARTDHAVVHHRHHRERRVLVRAARAWQRRRATRGAVVCASISIRALATILPSTRALARSGSSTAACAFETEAAAYILACNLRMPSSLSSSGTCQPHS